MDHPLEFEPEANMFEAHMIDLDTSRFLCLIDCASTHTILCHKEFFHHIKDQAPFDIKTIVGSFIGQGRAPPLSNFQVALPWKYMMLSMHLPR